MLISRRQNTFDTHSHRPVGRESTVTQASITILGVGVNDVLTFANHLHNVAKKVALCAAQLYYVMEYGPHVFFSVNDRNPASQTVQNRAQQMIRDVAGQCVHRLHFDSREQHCTTAQLALPTPGPADRCSRRQNRDLLAIFPSKRLKNVEPLGAATPHYITTDLQSLSKYLADTPVNKYAFLKLEIIPI